MPWKGADGRGQCVARKGSEVHVGQWGVEAPSVCDQQEQDLNLLENNTRSKFQHQASKGHWAPGDLARYEKAISVVRGAPGPGEDDDSRFSLQALRVALPPPYCGGGGDAAATSAARCCFLRKCWWKGCRTRRWLSVSTQRRDRRLQKERKARKLERS